METDKCKQKPLTCKENCPNLFSPLCTSALFPARWEMLGVEDSVLESKQVRQACFQSREIQVPLSLVLSALVRIVQILTSSTQTL